MEAIAGDSPRPVPELHVEESGCLILASSSTEVLSKNVEKEWESTEW